MKEKLQSIREEALKQIQSADVPEKLNDVRVRFLGKKGELTAVLKGMKDVAAEERPKSDRWSMKSARKSKVFWMRQRKRWMQRSGKKN